MPQPCISFQNINKSYGTTKVLNDISLDIPTGMITGFIGESGSGKTTLLQLANGLINPDGGRVEIFGTSLEKSDLSTIRHNIGYAVQGGSLFPHLTIYKNITLVAELLNWDQNKIQDRFNALMDLMELPRKFTDRYPHMLSGGQQGRVSLARSMMLNPKVLLLDEPFTGLDTITRNAIYDRLLVTQKKEPRTIILVSHDLEEAEYLIDNMVIIQKGNIAQIGSFEDIKNNPCSPYVEKLVRGRQS